MRRKRSFFDNYSKCWKFLNEARWHVVFALGVFCFLFLIGFAFPIFFREEIFKFIEELVNSLDGKNAVELIAFIFFNNLKACLLAIVFGIGFGIFPLITAAVNGYLLGFVVRESVTIGGLLIMLNLIPHGIFELPAILFSIGIGTKIGTDLINSNNKKRILKKNCIESLRFFVFVIFPLILIAGIIEGFLIWMGV